MKKIFILALVSMLSLPAGAAFKDSGWGVRPLGMGGAFTAIANDANAPLYNPAGIAQMDCQEATFMSARLFTGLENVDVGMNYFSFVRPISRKAGSVGIVWSSLFAPGMYREDAATLSYGRAMNDVWQLTNLDIALGGNLKYLRHEYSLDSRTEHDQVFSGGNAAGAVTGDIGVIASCPSNGLSVGFASKYVTSPDVGLKSKDTVPNENVLGGAWYQERLPYIGLPFCTVAADVVSRDKDIDYRFGIETWLMKGTFAVRGGADPYDVTFGLGYELKIGRDTKLIIDYAFALPLELSESTGSHRLGLSLRFP